MSSTLTLPAWASDILASVPKRGDGLNRWLLRASLALRRCGRSESDILDTLRCATAGEAIRPGEVQRAVTRSVEYLTDSGTPRPPAAKWPEFSPAARAEIVNRYDAGAVELWERSPFRLDDDRPHTEAIVDCLFPGNPLLCVADGPETATTGPRESFRGRLADFALIVPSPMTAPTGINQDGRESARCLDNTGARRFLIVEQDAGPLDEQAAVIMHLAEQAPLALVVHSGGKSLHSWFVCGSQAEPTLRRFFAGAVKLGADPATWTRCQLIRMPDGTRHKSDGTTRRQFVLYWNPATLETA